MGDIAERLRSYALHDGHSSDTHVKWCILCHEAADEIERLRNPWQPIETAPRDGTRVDLYGTRNGEPRRFPDASFRNNVVLGDVVDEYSWHHPNRDVYGEFVYTHWMPLPPPPVQEGDG